MSTSAAAIAAEVASARMAELLPRLDDVRREIARLQAAEVRLLAEAAEIAGAWAADEGSTGSSTAEFPHRSVAAEIAALWRVSDRTVQRQLGEATSLAQGFPETLAALGSGAVSLAHARIVVAAGAIIERPELRGEFEASVLDWAKTESASRLGPIAKRIAESFAESSFDERHRRARAERRVWVTDLEDGMAELGAILPAVIAHGIRDRLGRLARAVQNPLSGGAPNGDDASSGDDSPRDATRSARGQDRLAGGPAGLGVPAADDHAADARTIDQLRADILADLLLATDPVAHGNGPTGFGAIHATVQVTVPVLTLIDDRVIDPFDTASLDGHCPIDPDTARVLAGDASGWDRILTHPITGRVLAVDRYRPSEEQRRHLRVRDQHCRFPGCRLPTRLCDVDHTVDHAVGGATTSGNLAHLCRRHHTLKHQTAWSVVQRPGGNLEWTSPAGRTYRDAPTSAVAFAADPAYESADAPF